MKTDQLEQDRESWQAIDRRPGNNGARNVSPLRDDGIDGPTAAHREAWQQVIDNKLMAWAHDPSQLEDDGLDAPSAEMIRRAIEFAMSLQQAGFAPPTNVGPDPNGGIVFDRCQKELSEEFHFWDDGQVEYFRFQDARLVERRPV